MSFIDYKYKAMTNFSYMDAIDIYCFDDEDNYYVLEDGKYKAHKRGARNTINSILPLIAIHEAERFLQALLDVGVKTPDEGFCKGKLEATETHLEDMKTILFKTLKIQTKE